MNPQRVAAAAAVLSLCSLLTGVALPAFQSFRQVDRIEITTPAFARDPRRAGDDKPTGTSARGDETDADDRRGERPDEGIGHEHADDPAGGTADPAGGTPGPAGGTPAPTGVTAASSEKSADGPANVSGPADGTDSADDTDDTDDSADDAADSSDDADDSADDADDADDTDDSAGDTVQQTSRQTSPAPSGSSYDSDGEDDEGGSSDG